MRGLQSDFPFFPFFLFFFLARSRVQQVCLLFYSGLQSRRMVRQYRLHIHSARVDDRNNRAYTMICSLTREKSSGENLYPRYVRCILACWLAVCCRGIYFFTNVFSSFGLPLYSTRDFDLKNGYRFLHVECSHYGHPGRRYRSCLLFCWRHLSPLPASTGQVSRPKARSCDIVV